MKKTKLRQPDLFQTEANPFAGRITTSRDKVDRRLLALDIATLTGWCVCSQSGVWDLSTDGEESKGLRHYRFYQRLKEIAATTELKFVVYELPAIQGKFPNFVAVELMGVLKMFCAVNGMKFKGYPPATLKKWATGSGKAKKPEMVEAAKTRYGVIPKDDNEADALHLYHMAIEDLQL